MSPPEIRLDTDGAVDGRQLRAVAFRQVRLEYVQRALQRFERTASGRAVVVGSGRGDLARGLAGFGFEIEALDPSAAATALATEGADGVAVTYRTAPAHDLGLPGASVGLAYCADTFEIVDDLDRVLAEVSRVLRPGGVLVYDTVARTPLSRLIYLGAFQRIPATRIVPPGRYAAARLRPPAEIAAALTRHGLGEGDVCGFEPRSGRALVSAVLARRRGEITDAEIPDAVSFRLAPGHHPVVTYLGSARKPCSRRP